MKMLRTLYAKIFMWFWLTVTVGSLLVLFFTVFTGVRPLGRRWMRLTHDMYAHTAVDFYLAGGKPALQRYFDILRDSSNIDANLLDEQHRDVLQRPLPPHVAGVLNATLKSGQSTLQLGGVWAAATPIQYGQRQFTFVMEVHPLRGFIASDGSFALALLPRFALALMVAGIFCFFLARHIVAPVRALQSAAIRLAAGDLTSRVTPAIGHREDELADTARAFDQMADRIQLLLQKRQELLADISHELRSPLTRLSISLELMRRGETDVLDKMQTDLDRMNAMIGQVMMLTRLDVQNSPPAKDKVDLKPMLESIAYDAGFEGQQQLKSVEVHIGGSSPTCYVWADSNLLRSCIENVVRNAVRYTADGTVVDVTLETFTGPSDTGHYEITGADHGPGVPAASLPFLFDPFYRVAESRDRQEGGTGLGLSISKKVVTLHHGSIRADNRSDTSGLLVRMTFPAL